MKDGDDRPKLDVRCTECERRVLRLGGPDPPDPDRHGMVRVGFKCPGCGDRGTLVTPHPGNYGPTRVEKGEHFELLD